MLWRKRWLQRISCGCCSDRVGAWPLCETQHAHKRYNNLCTIARQLLLINRSADMTCRWRIFIHRLVPTLDENESRMHGL